MATHKVPQDVEAEDKLIGFLSLKQFIFVILGLVSGWIGFTFATKIHPLSVLIWIPPTAVFLILGLYQRKDQPVEIYLASALRFHLKPRTRKWDQEGYEERILITAPPKYEKHYTKDFSSEEATSRLSTLSHLMDSRGWATKMASDWQNPQLATAAASDRLVQPGQLQTGIDVQQYMQPADVMDENSSIVAQEFQSRIDQTSNDARQQALQVVQSARMSTPTPSISTPIEPPQTTTPTYQKYPQMHQKVVPAQDVSPAQAPPAPIINTNPITPASPVPNPAPQPEPEATATDDGSVEIKLH